MGGRIWKTVEHYYQASKFDESEIIDQVADAISPLRAKEVSRSHSGNVRKDWDTLKEMVMYRALNAKFSQHPDIQAKLIETHPLELIEYSEDDAYWGDPGDHTGANRLGSFTHGSSYGAPKWRSTIMCGILAIYGDDSNHLVKNSSPICAIVARTRREYIRQGDCALGSTALQSMIRQQLEINHIFTIV
jgi:ribA/ribD-fused uncharacterized protein